MQGHKEWLRFAEGDLKSAKIILKDEDELVITNILYLSQQCAEKSLKSYLVFNKQKPPKIHDLVQLVQLCGKIDLDFLDLMSHALELNPFITGGRYPDSNFAMPDTSIAHHAVKLADKIFEFVNNKI